MFTGNSWYEIFPKIFNISMTATIIIIAVLVIRLLLKKAPKVYSYALWLVVLFRLLCPVSISSAVSLLNLLDVAVTEAGSIEYVPENIVHTEYPAVNIPIPGVSQVINHNLPQGEEQLVADPLEAPVSIVTYIWLLGMAVLVSYSVIQYVWLRRRLIGAVRIKKNIYLADHIESPFVIGVLKPRIYLPSMLSGEEQKIILMHEQCHIRRGDHIFRLLAFVALCLHWFNPFVWLAFILSGKDMEMSCDEAVMRRMEKDIRAEYSESLLRFTIGKRMMTGMPLAFGEGDTKARIKNVMKYKKPVFVITALGIVIVAAVAVMLVTNPIGEESNQVANSVDDENNIGSDNQEMSNINVEENITQTSGQFSETEVENDIEGYSASQSEQIRAELEQRIVYREPSEYGTLEVWLDEVFEGRLLDTLFLGDAKNFRYLDVKSNIEALEMDGNPWIYLTAKMIFSDTGGDYAYEDSVLKVMIPISVGEDGNVQLGEFYADGVHAFETDDEVMLIDMGFIPTDCNLVRADVTHDGIEDYIVTTMYKDPERETEDVYEMLVGAGVGFLKVYDGSVVINNTGSALGDAVESEEPIWKKDFAVARPGNTQISLVYREGRAYLLKSDLNEQQGGFGYSYDVLALDEMGREYVVESTSMGFDTEEHSGVPNVEQKQQITAFKDYISEWFADAELLIATDVSADRQFIATYEEQFSPEQYYDTVWERY